MRSHGGTIIEGCTITENYGEHGGGIYLDGYGNGIVDTLISANEARRGGGLMSRVREPTLLVKCVIDSNKAKEAGGVYIAQAPLLFKRCSMSYNKAYGRTINDWRRGAIFENAVFENCTISHNWVDGSGGGFRILGWLVNPTFLNCVFAGNEATASGGRNTRGMNRQAPFSRTAHLEVTRRRRAAPSTTRTRPGLS